MVQSVQEKLTLDFTACLTAKIEKYEDVYGVTTCYQTEKGEEGWTPVIKKRYSSLPVSKSESSDDEPMILEQTKLVKYHKADGIPGLHVRTISRLTE